MLNLFTRFAIVAALAIPSQWYVVERIKKNVFRGREGSPGSALRLFVFLTAGNVMLLSLNLFGNVISGPEFPGRQFLAVTYYSLVAFAIGLSLFLLGLQTLTHLLVSLAGNRGGAEQTTRSAELGVSAPRDFAEPSREPDAPISIEPQPEELESAWVAVGHPAESALRRDIDGISRRSFLKWCSVAGMAASAGAMGYGLSEGFQGPVVNEFEISHKSLEGLGKPVTVVQVTDLHFGWFCDAPELERLVGLLNSIKADAVILTGDIFHSRYTAVESSEPILRKLIPRRYGNLVVMGNHELYVGSARSLESFRKSGLTHLGNKWISLQGEGAVIHLGGLDDLLVDWVPTPESKTFGRLMDRSPRGAGMRILLCHRPSILPLASYGGIDLVLAGHTHGGQMVVPWPGGSRGLSPAGLVSYYTHGWYRRFRCRMYLNRGAGLIYVPWRINCPPEIGVFHLVSPSGRNERESAPRVRRIGDSK